MSGAGPEVSVVVATRDRPDRLGRLLAALERQREVDFELIVVDDCSGPATRELLVRAGSGSPPPRVIRLNVNRGPAAAREAGWRAAAAPVIAFTDDDCRPDPDWLRRGLEALARSPGAVVQGRTVPDPADEDNRGPFARTIDVSAPDGAFQTCNVLYPREVLERVGGFDTNAFGTSPGGEDADLAWRAIAAGAPTEFAADAVVLHEIADLGPAGKLRVAARWTSPMQAYVRHPELRRRHFANRLFWKHSHMWLLRAASALLLRGRARVLAPLLVLPYARSLWARGKLEGGGPAMAPFFVLHDAVETFAVLRAAIRFRSPML